MPSTRSHRVPEHILHQDVPSPLSRGCEAVYIHQLIGRASSPEDAEQICRLFGHSLSRIQEPGYARGFCAINQDDHLTLLIQEEWYNQAGLRSWQGSAAYRKLQQSMQPLMEGIWGVTYYKEAS